MEQLTEFLVKEIADNKDAVKVTLTEDDTAFVLNVTLDEKDMGRVIGKEGKTANAIRTIVRAISGKTAKKVIIKFNEK